jgi:hypothetical protein
MPVTLGRGRENKRPRTLDKLRIFLEKEKFRTTATPRSSGNPDLFVLPESKSALRDCARASSAIRP